MPPKPLEPEEKCAGRLFRDHEQAQLSAAAPPTFYTPSVIAIYRHACPSRERRSTELELREQYIASPPIMVETSEGGVRSAFFKQHWARNYDVDLWEVPGGRFGFIYRAGRCRLCGATGRSKIGRVVDGWARMPLHGRVTR